MSEDLSVFPLHVNPQELCILLGIFVSYHQKLGTLLDIVNLTKACGVQKSGTKPMAIYFTLEMLTMIENLHEAGILHADIKADNFLLQGSFKYYVIRFLTILDPP